MIFWKEEYSIGIEIIDEQHKKLFDIANKIYDLLKDDFSVDKYDKIVTLIAELKDYTIFHFKTEEEYLLEHNYKKFLSHKVEHDEFVSKLLSVNLNNVDQGQQQYLEEGFKFVYSWIVDHILKKDKEYKAELVDKS